MTGLGIWYSTVYSTVVVLYLVRFSWTQIYCQLLRCLFYRPSHDHDVLRGGDDDRGGRELGTIPISILVSKSSKKIITNYLNSILSFRNSLTFFHAGSQISFQSGTQICFHASFQVNFLSGTQICFWLGFQIYEK